LPGPCQPLPFVRSRTLDSFPVPDSPRSCNDSASPSDLRRTWVGGSPVSPEGRRGRSPTPFQLDPAVISQIDEWMRGFNESCALVDRAVASFRECVTQLGSLEPL
jgi:hypothetical protein